MLTFSYCAWLSDWLKNGTKSSMAYWLTGVLSVVKLIQLLFQVRATGPQIFVLALPSPFAQFIYLFIFISNWHSVISNSNSRGFCKEEFAIKFNRQLLRLPLAVHVVLRNSPTNGSDDHKINLFIYNKPQTTILSNALRLNAPAWNKTSREFSFVTTFSLAPGVRVAIEAWRVVVLILPIYLVFI